MPTYYFRREGGGRSEKERAWEREGEGEGEGVGGREGEGGKEREYGGREGALYMGKLVSSLVDRVMHSRDLTKKEIESCGCGLI